MQCIPRTEAASPSVNDEGGRKKRSYCRAAEHLEDSVQLYENMYRERRKLHHLLAGAAAGVNAAIPHTEAASSAVNDEGGAKSGTFIATCLEIQLKIL